MKKYNFVLNDVKLTLVCIIYVNLLDDYYDKVMCPRYHIVSLLNKLTRLLKV